MGTKILIVDDEKNVRELLKKILKKKGYKTFLAANGKEALSVLDKENIDIIISDIKMPEMDGITLLSKVRKINLDVKFIIITAFATTETAIYALRNGANDYITKPFDINELLRVVETLAYKSKNPDANVTGDGDFFSKEFKTQSRSPKMKDVLEMAQQVAQSNSTVLLTGETGTGKEVLATAIHQWSKRANGPLIKINSGAIPDNLLESELFGYEKGAFTGAVTAKPGKFEIADGGTIFLDEIGDISPNLQVKLLRVLQERTIERLGGLNTKKVDVRVICATHRDLKKEIEKGNFREDLYYRLNVVPIHIPALRERREDIIPLVNYFLKSFCENCEPKEISESVLEMLKGYCWPGNIRELENIIERCVVISRDSMITMRSLPDEIINAHSKVNIEETNENKELSIEIEKTEKEIILNALEQTNGNKTKAAEILGISRRSLHRKLEKYSS